MHYLLNIGLNIPGTDKTLPAATALALVQTHVGRTDTIASSAVHASDTEPTLVLLVDGWPPYTSTLDAIAAGLLQDCVAYCKARVDADGNVEPLISTGELVGPKADDWGPFNPAFFILPNGTRAA
jgi:hypothetical protein